MARKSKKSTESKPEASKSKKMPPAKSIEGRENQLIALAVDLAEEQLRNGTASSQIITHYLRLGTTREQLEKEKIETELKLTKAKTEALESAKNIEGLYTKAIEAMKSYAGLSNISQEDVDD